MQRNFSPSAIQTTLIAAGALVGLCGLPDVTFAIDPEVEAIRDAWQAHRARIRTLDLGWTETVDISGLHRPPEKEEGVEVAKIQKSETRWWQDGAAVRFDRVSVVPRQQPSRTIVCDGQRYWEYNFVGDDVAPHHIRTFPASEESRLKYASGPGLGLYLGDMLSSNARFSLHRLSIAEVLTLGDCSVVGGESIAGADCVGVAINAWHEEGDPMPLSYIYWFDREHGHLIRRIEWVGPTGTLESDETTIPEIHEVATSLGTVYFPAEIVTARVGLMGRFERRIELTRVELNTEIAASQFRVPREYRDRIVDVRDRERVSKLQLDATQKRKELREAAVAPRVEPQGELLDATPRQTSWLRWMAISLAIGCFAVCLYLVVGRRRGA